MAQDLSQALSAGCHAMGLDLPEAAQQQLLRYLALLEKWNKAYNLSAVRNINDMLNRHLLDSLSVLTYIEQATPQRFIDVGTGGGLPGIPLAIVLPHWHWTLLDSNGKKTRFLTEVKAQLALTNVTVVNSRVELYRPEQAMDGVISRAFASLSDMITECEHLLTESGAFWAMKGQYPEQELQQIPKPYQLMQSWPLQVAGESGERHLLKLSACNNKN